jgi:hypothetical protein
MAKSIAKENRKFDHHDDKLKARDSDYSFGNLDQSSTDDGAGPSNEVFWGNGGNSAANYNIFVNHKYDIELGLKVHNRGGPDIPPTSTDADGTVNYVAPAGHTGSGASERALWNFDFSVNTGIEGSDDTLDHFDFRIIITSGDGERAVLNLTHLAPGVTPWQLAGAPAGTGIADQDGPMPGPGEVSGGSDQISQNSVNLGFGFLQAVFGSDYNDAGEHYDIELQAFHHHTLIGSVSSSIDIA